MKDRFAEILDDLTDDEAQYLYEQYTMTYEQQSEDRQIQEA